MLELAEVEFATHWNPTFLGCSPYGRVTGRFHGKDMAIKWLYSLHLGVQPWLVQRST
jgi:hypothetical protein